MPYPMPHDPSTLEPLERFRSEKARFLSGLVHELRTPLGSMLMLAELLGENSSGRLGDRELKYVQNIHRATSDVLALISAVGFLNRIEAGRVEVLVSPVPVAALAAQLEEELQPLAEHKGLAFDVEVAPEVPEILRTDRKLLGRMVHELVSNAVQVTERGSVAVRLSAPAAASPGAGERFTLAVRDTGVAVPAESLDALFEPFSHANPRSSRKLGGTGLGLAVAQALARLLGGDLDARSEAGTVTLTAELPVAGPSGALQGRAGASLRSSAVKAGR